MANPFDETSGFNVENKTLVPAGNTIFNFSIMGNPERALINQITPFTNLYLDNQAGVWG